MPTLSYAGYLQAAFVHAMQLAVRRRRMLLAAVVAILPSFIPLVVAYLSPFEHTEEGARVFIDMTENLYLMVLAPLLSLFFASLLIGEEVDNQTIGYLLVRPTPRSTIVLGRYAAFLIVACGLFALSLAFSAAGCLPFAYWSLGPTELRLFAHYLAVGCVAIAAYGAVSLWLGAVTKRPIVYGVILFFAWQQLVIQVPGIADFLTIHKYIDALQPFLPELQTDPNAQAALLGVNKTPILVGRIQAGIVLSLGTLAFLGLAVHALRTREFPTSHAAGT